MRVLLDENLPHDLVEALNPHSMFTVQGLGWAGVTNGDLLTRTSGRIDVFVTMDRNLEREHDLSVLSFGVLVVRARSNRIPDLLPLVPDMLAALDRLGPGRVEHVGSVGGRHTV